LRLKPLKKMTRAREKIALGYQSTLKVRIRVRVRVRVWVRVRVRVQPLGKG